MVVAITNQLLRILVVYEFLSSVIRRKLLNLWNWKKLRKFLGEPTRPFYLCRSKMHHQCFNSNAILTHLGVGSWILKLRKGHFWLNANFLLLQKKSRVFWPSQGGVVGAKKNSFYLGSQQRLKVHIPFSLQTLICIHNWKRRQQLFWQQKYCIQNWKSQLVKQHFLFCKQDIPTPHMINRPVVGQCAWRCQKFWPHNQYEISLCSCITEKQIVCLCCGIICEGVYIHQFNVGSLDDLGRDLTRVVQFSENPNFPRFICLTWKTKNDNVLNSLKIMFFPAN